MAQASDRGGVMGVTDLLQDAVLRVLAAADAIGVRVLLVHALSDDAKRFYLNSDSGSRPSSR